MSPKYSYATLCRKGEKHEKQKVMSIKTTQYLRICFFLGRKCCVAFLTKKLPTPTITKKKNA